MKQITVKEFIETYYVNQIDDLVSNHPYHSFLLMASGIEFFGKCLDDTDLSWDTEGKSRTNFNKAIKSLDSFLSYRTLIGPPRNLYHSLRCGMAHSASPKNTIFFVKQEPNTALDYSEWWCCAAC